MKEAFLKAKKTIILGIDEIKEKAGTKQSTEDPEFLLYWEKLQNLEMSTLNLHKSLSDLMNSTQKLCESSCSAGNTISSSFDENTMPYFQDSQNTVNYLTECKDYCNNELWNKVKETCLDPLRDFLNKIIDLKVIAKKRKKNKILCEAAKDPHDIAKRQEKYTRYHTAYVDGVKALQAQQEPLFVSVFNQHQFCMRDFIEHAKQGSGGTA